MFEHVKTPGSRGSLLAREPGGDKTGRERGKESLAHGQPPLLRDFGMIASHEADPRRNLEQDARPVEIRLHAQRDQEPLGIFARADQSRESGSVLCRDVRPRTRFAIKLP